MQIIFGHIQLGEKHYSFHLKLKLRFFGEGHTSELEVIPSFSFGILDLKLIWSNRKRRGQFLLVHI